MAMRKISTVLALAGCGLAAILAGCAETPRPRALVITQQCADLDFPVYFNRLSAKLTRPAEQVIADAGRASKGCSVAMVRVTGLAGGRSDHPGLLDLSSRRASTVAKALTLAGFPAPRFDVTAVADAAAPADAAHEPLQRRAEVVITFSH